jgi:hypothetical protein
MPKHPNSLSNLDPHKTANTRRIEALRTRVAVLLEQAPELTDRQVDDLAAILAPLSDATRRAA